MAENGRNIEYRRYIESGAGKKEMLIGYKINPVTKQKEYFVMNEIDGSEVRAVRQRIEEFNQNNERKAGIVTSSKTKILTREKVKKYFVSIPCSEENAKEQIRVLSQQDDVRKRKNQQLATRIGAGLAAGAIALNMYGFIRSEQGKSQTDATAPTWKPTSSHVSKPSEFTPVEPTINFNEIIQSPQPSTGMVEIQKPIEPQQPEVVEDLNFDEMTYRTYKNSGGVDIIELADMFEIVEECRNYIMYKTNEYNKTADTKIVFDFDMASTASIVAQVFQESSAKDLSKRQDIDDACIGSFKIGNLAQRDINKVSQKILGEDILRDREDRYNFARAACANIMMRMKNFEYCAKEVGAENVTEAMVNDCYLWGGTTIRKDLRDCVSENKEYTPRAYSRSVGYYTEALEKYEVKLKSGETDGSHDKIFNETFKELYARPNFNKIIEEEQRLKEQQAQAEQGQQME